MVVPPAPDGALNDPSHDRPAPSSTRLAVAGALAVVVVACLVLAGTRLATAGLPDGGGDVADRRETVMSVTDQFVRRMGTYGPDLLDDSGQMPAYREQVREVITSKFAADFDKQVPTVEQVVQQAGVEREAEVFATAVSSSDDDSARVLVAGSFTDSYTQGKGDKARTIEQEPFPFRFTVDLVVIDGEWLVDDFTPAGGTGAEGAPVPEPTGGAQ